MTKHAWVAVFLFGCGGGGGGRAAVPLADLGSAIGTSYCAKEFACCTDAEVMADFMSIKLGGQPITTEAQCVELYTGLFMSTAQAQYAASVQDGRAVYDGDAVAACLDALDAQSCPAFGAGTSLLTGDCASYLIPQVADGGACAQSYECTSDNCVGARTSPAMDGTCQPVPGAGQPCSGLCAAGLTCTFGGTGSETCQPPAANGATCTSNANCTSNYCDRATDPNKPICADRPARCDGR